MTTSDPEPVLLVHGLYLGPWSMAWLARQLAQAGFCPQRFGYDTLRETPAAAARRLSAVAADVPGVGCHFVGHSLGGLVLRHLFHDSPPTRPGRVVTLGTPHQGSRVGQILHERRWGRLLGSSRHAGILGGVPPWRADKDHPLGVIAGSRPLGVGRFVAGLRDGDGTVGVDETTLEGMADYRLLPVSHTSMLLSRVVARQVIAFLRDGCFGGPAGD